MVPGRPSGRPRSNTARSYQDRYGTVDEDEPQNSFPEHRPTLRPSRATSAYHMDPPSRDSSVDPYPRPVYSRTPTFEGPTQLRRGPSPASSTNSINRVASDSTALSNARSQLRVISKGNGTVNGNGNVNDPYYDSTDNDTSPVKSSPDRYFSGSGRSVSPAASSNGHGYGNGSPRYTNGISSNSTTPNGKKAPPPPPPSRAKKPPPPPPPAKRVISGLENM